MPMDEDKTNPTNTKGRILDAALDIFSNKGYYKSRMDDIVDEARVSKGSIYFHFPNKERLFLALVDQFADVLERNVEAAIAQEAEGIDRVRAAVRSVLTTFGRYRRPAKLLLVQAVGLGAVFEQKRQEVHERFAGMIQGFLDEAVSRRGHPAGQYKGRRPRLDGRDLHAGYPVGDDGGTEPGGDFREPAAAAVTQRRL